MQINDKLKKTIKIAVIAIIAIVLAVSLGFNAWVFGKNYLNSVYKQGYDDYNAQMVNTLILSAKNNQKIEVSKDNEVFIFEPVKTNPTNPTQNEQPNQNSINN